MAVSEGRVLPLGEGSREDAFVRPCDATNLLTPAEHFSFEQGQDCSWVIDLMNQSV